MSVDNKQFFSFIRKVFGNSKVSADGQNISVMCPICKSKKNETYSKTKLVIRTDGLCHCWVCDYKSKNLVHIIKLQNYAYLKEYASTFMEKQQVLENHDSNNDDYYKQNTLSLPESFQLLATAKPSHHVNTLKEYVKSRLTDFERDLWYWKLGLTDFDNKEYRNRIIIPSFDDCGNLNYFTGRHIKGFNPKYKNPVVKRENIIFNEINLDWSKELTLVEGPFDLVKCNDNATCVLGSSLNKNYLLFQKIVQNKTPILLAFDPDAAKKALDLAKTFSEYDIQTRIINIPTQTKAKDIGDLTKSQFKQLSQQAKLYTSVYDFRSRLNMLTH